MWFIDPMAVPAPRWRTALDRRLDARSVPAQRARGRGSGSAVRSSRSTARSPGCLYKKAHWQVAGHTFYQLHLLFDKHYDEQVELVDMIAERIQLLGGISLAMGADVAEETRIPRPPRGREEVPVQISRLLEA